MDDVHCYSPENVLRQVDGTEPLLGAHEVRFYVLNGRPSREHTGEIATFHYYPSGGTIRDASLNILHYEPRLDIYHTSRRG